MAAEEAAEVEMEMQGEREALAERRAELTKEIGALYEQRMAAVKAKREIMNRAVAEIRLAWGELRDANAVPAQVYALENEREKIERQLRDLSPAPVAEFIGRMERLSETIRKNGHPSKTVKLPPDDWGHVRSEIVADLEAIPAAFRAIAEARRAAERLVLEAPSLGDLPGLLAALEPELPKSVAVML